MTAPRIDTLHGGGWLPLSLANVTVAQYKPYRPLDMHSRELSGGHEAKWTKMTPERLSASHLPWPENQH